MSSTLIMGLVIAIVVPATCIAVSLISSKSVSTAFRLLETSRERDHKRQTDLVDRLMAIDFERYLAGKSIEDDESGGFFEPEDQEEGEVVVLEPRPWGRMDVTGENAALLEHEAALIEEDFGADR